MPIYARTTGWRARQIAADLFVVVWTIAWWFIGQVLADLLRDIAAVADTTATASSTASGRLSEIADVAGSVPLVGKQLSSPFDELASLVDSLSAGATAQVATLDGAAPVVGWLTFCVPVALLVLVWLPRRITFARNARATLAIAGRPGSQDLLALRALSTLPAVELAQVSGDPAHGWRTQDPAVIAHLARLALMAAGVAPRPADPAPAP